MSIKLTQARLSVNDETFGFFVQTRPQIYMKQTHF